MMFVAWLLSIVFAVIAVVQLFQGDFLPAIAWALVACLVGPGGYSVFRTHKHN